MAAHESTEGHAKECDEHYRCSLVFPMKRALYVRNPPSNEKFHFNFQSSRMEHAPSQTAVMFSYGKLHQDVEEEA